MMRPARMGVPFALLAACAIGGSDPTYEQALAGTAGITLKSSSARITQTSDTEWNLTKTGTISGSTVTWTVTATQGATVSGHLVVNGTMTVTNTGTGGATIGNIVVNLQTKSGPSWVTASSDIADATHDDAATIAHIVAAASSEHRSVFTENAASGQLLFTDANTNTVFSLVPEVTIAPGSTVTLLFSASYDNNVLGLATGTPVRIETIVSFGNAQPSAISGSNIDINGNGVIDPDEARVRSVASRLGLAVPAPVPGNTTVTLTDTTGDITTTGTVTCGAPTFNLGPNGGTVTITCDGGASGGTVTNCAHLSGQDMTVTSGGYQFPSVSGVDLTACNTQTIGPHTCTPGAPGCGWEAGDMVTNSQATWGDPATSAAALLVAQFANVYPAGLEVGIPGTGGYSMTFTLGDAVVAYLPAVGITGTLTGDLLNPTSSSSGSYGGEVVALALNVDYSSLLGGDAGVGFGSLRLCGYPLLPSLNNLTVSQILAIANTVLGGGSAVYGVDEMAFITNALNASFAGGTPSTFAQDYLYNTASCP